jgi:hypothetical protein
MKILHLGQPPHIKQDEGITLKQCTWCEITPRLATTMAKNEGITLNQHT